MCEARFCSVEHRKARGDLTSANVPAGTSSPAGMRELDHVWAVMPVEWQPPSMNHLNSVPSGPHAMQNHGELSSNRGFAEPASFGDPHVILAMKVRAIGFISSARIGAITESQGRDQDPPLAPARSGVCPFRCYLLPYV